MSGRILVVDDIEANVRLLEARLMAEYFQVLTDDLAPKYQQGRQAVITPVVESGIF